MEQKKEHKPCSRFQQSQQSKGRTAQSQERSFSGGKEQGGERTGK